MHLVDSHCHLNYKEFSDLDVFIKRAFDNDVRTMMTIGTKRSDFEEVTRIASAYPSIYASIGVHPHEAEHHADLSVGELVAWCAHPKVIGLGETGLDYYYEHSPKDIQQQLFRTHIEAARQTGLPLIVHSRDADEDTVAILHEEYEKGAFKGLIHCFSSSKYLSDKSIEIGFLISLSGIITFKKSDELRNIAKDIPLSSLLVETDAPYLTPMPHRGKPNEPAYTRYVAQTVAEIKSTTIEEVAKVTSSNFFKLFSKAEQSVP